MGIAARKVSRPFSSLIVIGVSNGCLTVHIVPPDNAELLALAEGFTTSLKAVYGTSYQYGGSCKTIYKTTGSSDDYAYTVS
jgi:hypothetical protein